MKSIPIQNLLVFMVLEGWVGVLHILAPLLEKLSLQAKA